MRNNQKGSKDRKSGHSILGLIQGFNFAIDGFLFALKNERNMKIHLLTAIAVVCTSMFFDFTKVEFAILTMTIAFVFFAEMTNTAIEKAIDIATLERNPLAKVAKDVAAGAVLVAALNSVFIGYLLFFDRIVPLTRTGFTKIRQSPYHMTFLVIVLVLLLTLLFKSKFKKKGSTHLQGGTVSGHSSLAFALAMMIALLSGNELIIIMSYALAFLVAESRVEGEIHEVSEVIYGALLGSVVSLLAFNLFLLL